MDYAMVEALSPTEYDDYLENGWRRFGSTLLRPNCRGCSKCVPIRLSIAEFRPSRSQRRARRRNSDLEVTVREPSVTLEHVQLYLDYHAERHRSRDWPAPKFEVEEYLHCFLANAALTHEFQYRSRESLLGVAYAGESDRALNSIYAYFDPTAQSRSLGTFNVLSQLDEAQRREKVFLYLGYWVRECPSMAYKARFRPHQLRTADGWGAPPPTDRVE